MNIHFYLKSPIQSNMSLTLTYPFHKTIPLFKNDKYLNLNRLSIPFELFDKIEYFYSKDKEEYRSELKRIEIPIEKIKENFLDGDCLFKINDILDENRILRENSTELLKLSILEEEKIEVIVILGAMIGPDGKPSIAASCRVKELVSYLQLPSNKKRILIFSGGMVKQTVTPESTSMRNDFITQLKTLTDQKIIEANFINNLEIFEESFAKNTFENALFSRILMEHSIGKINRITLLTSEFHMKRSKILFENVFEGYEIKCVESKTDYDEETMKERVNDEKERIENMENYLKKKGFTFK